MIVNKPVLLFTTFWKANYLINKGYFFEKKDKETYYKISLISLKDEEINFKIFSIALGIPDIKKLPNLYLSNGIKRLEMFCPTYDLLMDYKENRNWDNYKIRFKQILKKNVKEIKKWLDNIIEKKENFVYILCCWEETSLNKEFCHRKLIFDSLKNSFYKDKFILIYDHGDF